MKFLSLLMMILLGVAVVVIGIFVHDDISKRLLTSKLAKLADNDEE